jgi:ribonuclease BN (tRNA processing enzyme)
VIVCQATDALRQAAMQDPTPELPISIDPSRRAPRKAPRDANRLILLGTAGGGNPKNTRSGFSNAVVVGDVAYVFDCGEGSHQQAWRAGISMHPERRPRDGATTKAMFFSHLHADHVIDYVNFLMGFWPMRPIDVYGPGQAGLPITSYPPGRIVAPLYPEEPTPGIRGLTNHLFRAFAYNINVRIADEGRHDVTKMVNIHEIGVPWGDYIPDIDLGVIASGATTATAAPAMDPVVIMPTDENGVQVSAILVQHAPVFPAMAYRIDTPSGSVVISGDTGPCDNVVRLAQGADVLVHEVIDVPYLAGRISKLVNREAIIQHLTESHTAPEDAARIAQRAGVKTLVMTHLVPGDDEFTTEQWEAKAGSHFDGEVVCGVDLDQFVLG